MKIVQEYKKMIRIMQNGGEYNYDHITAMLDFLDMPEAVDNPEVLANHFMLL